jgi:hypothetical protein
MASTYGYYGTVGNHQQQQQQPSPFYGNNQINRGPRNPAHMRGTYRAGGGNYQQQQANNRPYSGQFVRNSNYLQHNQDVLFLNRNSNN